MKRDTIAAIFLPVIIALLACTAQAKKFEHLGQTPALGWNSWNTFACDVDEKMIRQMADAMVKSGMKDAGYEYINIDDCWHGERDELGFIQVNKERFPSGMKALADYVHAKELKIGIYSDAGGTTCAGYPGSRGYEYQDAKKYAEWGIDYLKYDWCDTEGLKAEGAYMTMRDAIYATGRPMMFSICEWGDNDPWEWAQDIGHSWRTTGDIYPCWNCEYDHGTWSSWGVLRILDMQDGLRKHAGPGHWNDMDMMEVGMGMTEEEDKSHFTLWALLNSPLIAGNDLRNMSDTTRKILTNKDIIAINQDELGVQGFKFLTNDDIEVWFKPLLNNEWAMVILNRGGKQNYTYKWRNKAVEDELSQRVADFTKTRYNWRNLWTGEKGDTKGYFKVAIPEHGVIALRLTPQE